VLPDADDFPSLPAELAVDAAVAGHVVGALFIPELPVGFGAGVALGAPVPETSVDEYGNFLSRECKVWFPIDTNLPSPSGDLVPLQENPHGLLRRLIARWPDTGHDFGALRRPEDICHKLEQVAKEPQIRIFWGAYQKCAIEKAITFLARSFGQ